MVRLLKNVLIYTPSNEKLLIAKHANGFDFKVITYQWNVNSFICHRLTALGLDTDNPVISRIGSIVSDSIDNVLGQMKDFSRWNQISCLS